MSNLFEFVVGDDNTRILDVRQGSWTQRCFHIRTRSQTRRVTELPFHGAVAHIRKTAKKRPQPTTDPMYILLEHTFKLWSEQ